MQEALPPPAALETDDDRLRGLGYRPRLSRVLGLSANFSVAFTFMAPVIGIFTMFTLGLSTAGPAYLWLTFIPLAGLLLVAVVLGRLARQYPATGGLYQYAKYTAGPVTGWFTGWFYGIALLLTVAAVDAGAVNYVTAFTRDVFGQTFTPTQHSVILVIALGLLVIQTALNMLGVRVTRVVALIGVLVGLLGTFGFAIVLAVHGFHHGVGFLTSTQDVQHTANNPLGVSFGGSWIAGALVALIAPVYIFRGFQAPTDLTEETRHPGRQGPLAMRLALIVGGIAAFVLTAALLLAMPGGAGTVVKTVQGGGIPYILATLPSGLQETMLGLIVLAFFTAGAAVQAAGSRLIFSFARDGALPGGKSLAEVSERFKTPANALFIGALATVVLVGIEFASPSQDVKVLWFSYPAGGNALTSLATFAVTGLYLALLLTVIGSMIGRARGRVSPGRWAWPLSIVAALYLVLMLADLIAPTGMSSARAYFNQDWITAMAMVAIALIGVVVLLLARRGYRAGEADTSALDATAADPSAADPSAADSRAANAGEGVPVPGTVAETTAEPADPGNEAP